MSTTNRTTGTTDTRNMTDVTDVADVADVADTTDTASTAARTGTTAAGGTNGAAGAAPGPRTATAHRRGTRRPSGPAGRGPGPAGNRGPTLTPYLSRTGTAQRRPATPSTPASAARTPLPAPDTPLPTPGARRRAQESRPHRWFAHQLLLTLSGQRPVHVLLGHALPAAYDRLAELAPLTPLRPYVAPGRRAPVPTLHECGLCRPCDGVIEAFARIATGARLRALAFRLELGTDTRWRCAALDIGPAPATGALVT
ncbi:Rv3235 family protein [Streptomyces sp. YGL11-2]|uniref:Rv3235 family protein n=1 Tax=Streptomyces sp. YGL11-2 TaxID=3414028 RepID=UPI003CF37B0D